MSTNKRKEAAALFELIDKSTLKVPKHAGALKIPAWWSSKTNPVPAPPPAASAPVSPAPAAHSAPGTPSNAATPTRVAPIARNGTPVPAATAAPASIQQRLFQPPPPGTEPASTPSIRPPMPNGAPTASRPTAAVVTAAPEPEPETFGTEPISEEELDAPAPSATTTHRVFAPQTVDPSSISRRSPSTAFQRRARNLSRTPMWAIVAGISLVVVLVGLIAFLFMRPQRSGRTVPIVENPQAQAAGGEEGATLLPPQRSNSLLPTPNTDVPPQNLKPAVPTPPAPQDAAPAEAKVYEPGTVDRSPELYYIVIASTPSERIARRNAEFLAAHGVDVSVEIRPAGRSGEVLYTLVSVQGYHSMSEAEPFRKKIVAVGHLTLDYKKYRKAWDDAYICRVKSVAQH